MNLQTKFLLSLLIMMSGILVVSTYIAYKTAETESEKDAYKTCFNILASVEASRTFVREKLRPIVKKIIDKDDFIPEAMSASFVARNQFENFLKDYPDYHVKFASTNPRNPTNIADDIEISIINQFDKDIDLKEWQGVTNRNNKKFYTVAKPFRFKKKCMHCHSDPETAPKTIVETYGKKLGFWRQIGDVTMYSISVPIDVTYSEVWRHTYTFLIPIIAFVSLISLVSFFLFKQMVSKPILLFSERIKQLSEEDYQTSIDERESGELKNLAITFNTMTKELYKSDKIRKRTKEKLRKAHDDLEYKVQERTEELLTKNEALKKEIKQREEAESEIKVLSGLLPICSHCKKIKDDKGYWKQLEAYIQEKSEAEFSHSICQECAKKHYPDYNIYDE